MYAKQGSMVAYGQMDFAYKGQGVGGFIRRAVSGEGQDLMRVRGRGTVWFAESGSHISVFHLDSRSPLLRPTGDAAAVTIETDTSTATSAARSRWWRFGRSSTATQAAVTHSLRRTAAG